VESRLTEGPGTARSGADADRAAIRRHAAAGPRGVRRPWPAGQPADPRGRLPGPGGGV